VFPQPVWSVSREWQPLLVADSGTGVLHISAFASLCKRQPTIIVVSSLVRLSDYCTLLMASLIACCS
jgi:hypothetical protein